MLKKKLILLDTHAIIHRAYHALPEFMNSKGEPTGALYGLATMLFKIITELKPDYIVACYDLPKKTFRHEAYDDYKKGRAKTDDALVSQIIKSRDFFKALSIPFYECEGFEADDLLGTISNQVKSNKDLEVIIASGDMDTLQLIDGDRVQVYTLKKGINDTILYNEKKVYERFGFYPKMLPDYKGLRGDPSDNIIGIKGIGEKTATILISKYGTVENLYKNIKKNKEELISLGITPRVLNLLEQGEDEAMFSKTLATIRLDAPINFIIPPKKWDESVSLGTVDSLFKELEFKSLHNRFINILNNSDPKNTSENISKTTTDYSLENENDIKKAQIAFWLLNSEMTDPSIEDIVGYKGSVNLKETLLKLEKEIEKEELDYVYRKIEIPIIPIIDEMEKNGISIDLEYLNKIGKEYHVELSLLEKSIWEKSGREFNINSPKQLGEILFDELGLSTKGMKKSPTGARSTKESELEKIQDLHPVVGEILKYRELQKLLSTYIDSIPKLISKDGRLHARFIQTGTTTGRFASSNPNLQNIPNKTEKGKNIRNAFVSKPGYMLVSFDYSQIELRVAALLSQDEYFIKAFKEGRDIHSAVAVRVFEVKEEDVTLDMRRRAKIINFGILYGMGVNALRQNIGTDRKEAQLFYDNYFAEFPTIRNYLDSIKNYAIKNGYTKTLFGRKRYFPGIKSPLPFIRAMAERMAINAPIQGTATADIIKIGMKNACDKLKENRLTSDARLVLQVHDELIYEIKEDKVNQTVNLIQEAMVNVIPPEFTSNLNTVPLLVSVGIGKRWGDLK